MAPRSLLPTEPPETQAKINHLKSETISSSVVDAALLLVCFQILFALAAALLQRYILPSSYRKTNLYKQNATTLNERHHISFVYHHIAAVLFPVILIFGAAPAIRFTCGSAELGTVLFTDRKITVGDTLLVISLLYSAYYLFEVIFRAKFISIIALAHHIGLLLVTQTALVLVADPLEHGNASAEFYMCMIWGMFDIATELPIHYTMILWRLKRGSHRLCYYMACSCAVWVTTMSLGELAVTTYLLNQSWNQWELIWRVITPLIFSLWICTQLYGAKIFMGMALQERRMLKLS
ncbi:hypothetical protein AB5N19_11690 [Seiridium cardinale]|uniref:TLC domain-containing protein n=1 Tax=Seiridium cardinale TaxID=138064 RepID=A0ABR2XE45_9PEZI